MLDNNNMERVNLIWSHPLYKEYLHRLQEFEKNREFCRHTPEHFLDVARLTWIYVLENGLKVSREEVYAAALLHDIGRIRQYEDGTDHAFASGEIARIILPECGFDEGEIGRILESIQNHRIQQEETDFAGCLYRADKVSRLCFLCNAREECNWSDQKKNLEIKL